ncbi:type VI secretion system contractile sheath small subunit [Enterobacter ludwigii]
MNKLNIQQMLAEFAPSVSFDVKHKDGDEETEERINLAFRHMKGFSPEQVARQMPCCRRRTGWRLSVPATS